MDKTYGLSHLFMTVFLYCFANFMVVPPITDVTMAALCPGKDKCSFAIYLTGAQQAIIGLGSLVVMPMVGNLSDTYGRKVLLTVPMTFGILPLGPKALFKIKGLIWTDIAKSIFEYAQTVNLYYKGQMLSTKPILLLFRSLIISSNSALELILCFTVITVILACGRTKYFFYAYYVLKTVISMVTDGSVQFLAFAYVADNVPESRRVSVFGIMSGISSASFVFGNLSARFLSTSATFEVAASMAVVSLVYMRVFLPESMMNNSICAKKSETTCLLEKAPKKKWQLFKNLPSVDDTICLLRISSTFSKAAAVAFFVTVADVGLVASLNYYLKAQFHFNKDQFADLMIIAGMAGSISQLILMPILTPLLGEEKMLSIGLFFSCAHMVLYSMAWAPWVPYAAAMISVVATFAMPCLRSIASKQIGPNEQGKAQGCITGICSFASIVSPLAFSPLTALFLSDSAPFHFPGFSLMCSGFAAMIAFIQSIMIKAAPNTSCSTENSNSVEP